MTKEREYGDEAALYRGSYVVVCTKEDGDWMVMPGFWDQIQAAVQEHEETGVARVVAVVTLPGARMVFRSSQITMAYLTSEEARRKNWLMEAAQRGEIREHRIAAGFPPDYGSEE